MSRDLKKIAQLLLFVVCCRHPVPHVGKAKQIQAHIRPELFNKVLCCPAQANTTMPCAQFWQCASPCPGARAQLHVLPTAPALLPVELEPQRALHGRDGRDHLADLEACTCRDNCQRDELPVPSTQLLLANEPILGLLPGALGTTWLSVRFSLPVGSEAARESVAPPVDITR